MVLRILARCTQTVEHAAFWLIALYVLNFISIAWLNLHQYGAAQMPVLVTDAVFLFGATLLYVLLLGFVPIRRVRRALFFGSFCISALLAVLELFAIGQYETLIGAGIITAMLQTNPNEAKEFLSMYASGRGLLFSLLSIILIAFCYRRFSAARRMPFSRHLRTRLFMVVLVLGALSGILLWQTFHSFIVNDSLDIPAVRVARSADTAVRNIEAFEKLKGETAREVTLTANASDTPYVIFILGESTNRARMHLYGYPLENTPGLDAMEKSGEIAICRDVISPETATVAVLQKLFTFADAESDREWYTYNNLIDVMRVAGYKTFWLSNQESSGIWGNVAQLFAERSDYRRFTRLRDSHEDMGEHDEALFPLVDEALAQSTEKNFFVIHLMGGHGLYYMRFPYLFTKFTAADVPPPQDTLSEEKRTEIAQYENALFYNDFIVTSLIGKFAEKDALIVYLPDHGEAVYDNGVFSGHVEEHPTKETLEVPLIFWASPAYRAHHPEKWAAIEAAKDRPYMTDDFIHTLLDLLGIQTEEYDPAKSIVNPAFDAKRHRVVKGHDYDMEFKGMTTGIK